VVNPRVAIAELFSGIKNKNERIKAGTIERKPRRRDTKSQVVTNRQAWKARHTLALERRAAVAAAVATAPPLFAAFTRVAVPATAWGAAAAAAEVAEASAGAHAFPRAAFDEARRLKRSMARARCVLPRSTERARLATRCFSTRAAACRVKEGRKERGETMPDDRCKLLTAYACTCTNKTGRRNHGGLSQQTSVTTLPLPRQATPRPPPESYLVHDQHMSLNVVGTPLPSPRAGSRRSRGGPWPQAAQHSRRPQGRPHSTPR